MKDFDHGEPLYGPARRALPRRIALPKLPPLGSTVRIFLGRRRDGMCTVVGGPDDFARKATLLAVIASVGDDGGLLPRRLDRDPDVSVRVELAHRPRCRTGEHPFKRRLEANVGCLEQFARRGRKATK